MELLPNGCLSEIHPSSSIASLVSYFPTPLLLAKEYRAAGGGYRNQGRTTEQRSLIQWTNGDCQQAYAATIRVKRQGMKDGQQFIPNAPKAKQAAKKYLD